MPDYRLDWQRPPLTENQRWSHWSQKNAVVRSTRLTGRLLTRALRGSGRVEVTLTWYVKDHRTRDADNLVPTLKALCDGLVDAEVVPDDTPQFMVKHMPVIVVDPTVVPHLVLSVRPLD